MARNFAGQAVAVLALLAGSITTMEVVYAGGTVRAAPPEVQAAPAPVTLAPAPPVPVAVALHCGPGYVCNSERQHVRDVSGHCVRTGSWTPALAEPGCDPLPGVPVIIPR